MLIDLDRTARPWFVGAFACFGRPALLTLWLYRTDPPARRGGVLLLGTLSNMCVGTMSLAVLSVYAGALSDRGPRALWASGAATGVAEARPPSSGPSVVGMMLADFRSHIGVFWFFCAGCARPLPSLLGYSRSKQRGACSEEISP